MTRLDALGGMGLRIEFGGEARISNRHHPKGWSCEMKSPWNVISILEYSRLFHGNILL